MESKTIIYGCSDISAIAEKICSGAVGVLPTSTIYGISCIYDNEYLLNKVYAIKQRPANMPFITLIPCIDWLEKICCNISRVVQALAEKYWLSDSPEPLTLILEKRSLKEKRQKNKCSQDMVSAARETIAIRLDFLPEIIEITKLSGPIISTSATISGTDIAPKTIRQVPAPVREKVDFIFDYGKPLAGLASTIIDVTGDLPVLIREGSLKYCDILKFLDSGVLLK